MTGGHLYPGSGGISLSNSASLLLGGGTVHVTNAAWASDAALTLTGEGGDTVFQTEGNTATLSGTLSGAGGLVKRGAGTLTFAGRVAFKGRLDVAEGAVTFSTLAAIDGLAELVATNGTIAFANSSSLDAPPYYLDTLRVTTGKLSMGTGCFLYVAAYIVDGVAQPLGSYTVGAGQVKVVNFWTGRGADSNWTTPDNWGGGGCPTGLTAIAYFTNSANVTLDRDVIVGRTILNGGGSTVTLSGAGRIYTVGQNIDSQYKSFMSREVNDRLVVQTEVRMYSATHPHERLYCNATPFYRGTVAFQGRVKINNGGGYVFVSGGTQTEFSGDANVGPDVTGASGIALGMNPLNGGNLTCRVLDNASLRVNTLEMCYSKVTSGSVVQEGPGTSVTLVQALYMGVLTDSTVNRLQSYFLNNGSLTVGKLYCGHNLPGLFLMTNGTLTATSVILGRGTTHACSFSMTGGNAYLGSGGIAYSNSASMSYLGGVTVHATAPWISSAALNLTGEGGNTVFDTAGYNVTVGALDGAGGLVKSGAGTLTLGGANVFTGGVTVAGGTLAAGSGLANATNLSVTASGAVLSLGSADSLNTNATLALSAGGLVNLNFSGTATVGALVVNGTEKSPGTYGSGSPFITGTGVLRVLNGPAPQGTLFSIL